MAVMAVDYWQALPLQYSLVLPQDLPGTPGIWYLECLPLFRSALDSEHKATTLSIVQPLPEA